MYIANYQIVKLTTDDIISEDRDSINHIWLYDRSGSMHNTLPELCDNMLQQAKLLKVGDTLTICWFSGEGQTGEVIKGFINKGNYSVLEAALNKNNTIVGSTCFSESFLNLKTIISQLPPAKIMMCLFTDGYPVVDNYQKELIHLNQAIAEIKDDLSSVLLIGYGETYNKELLVEMAQRLNGTVIHSSALPVNFVIGEYQRSTISFPSSANILLACSALNDKIYVHDIEQAKQTGQFSIVGSDLYLLLEGNNLITSEEINDTALYGLTAALVQKAKSNIALLILNYLGDKYLMDLVINAFTNGEYGKAETAILLAMCDVNYRFIEGKVEDYLPDENAFCLLDFLFLLMEDKEARFYPKHPTFKYNKIGESVRVKDGYAKFISEKNIAVPITNMTWHKEKLNLSILCKIPGTVCFEGDGSLIAEAHSTFQYRNYTIIKNGVLNVEQFPFTCSDIILNKLLENGIKFDNDDGINILKLSTLPFINRVLVDNRLSAKSLGEKAVEQLKLEAKMKVFNNKNPNNLNKNNEVSKELLDKGFRSDGSYNPPTETVKGSNDYYLAKTFKIKIKGGSTIPKVETVENKIAGNKKLNFVEQFMKEALDECKKDDIVALQKVTKKELKEVRKYIQETKFAVILSKRWFEEFNSLTDCTITTDTGYVVTFELGEEKVMID